MSMRRRLTLVNARSYDILGGCSKNIITCAHYFVLYRLSLFHFDIFIICVT